MSETEKKIPQNFPPNWSAFEVFIYKLDRILSIFEQGVPVLCFALMLVFVLFNVLSRFALHIPLLWIEEASRYLMIVAAMIGLGIVTRKREHLRLDMIVELMPPKGKYFLVMFGKLLAIVIFGVLIYLAVFLVKRSMMFIQESPGLLLPMWIMHLIMCVGFINAALREIMLFWNDYFSRNKVLASDAVKSVFQ